MQLSGKVFLVVGASSGIGRQVAIKAAQKGAKVVVTARRQALLDELAGEVKQLGGECLAIASDALDEHAAQGLIDKVVEQYGVIDIALLNVGDGPAFNMSKCDAAAVKQNMQINYDTMVNYLTPLIQQMKSQQHGLVAHTNSLAGFLGLPMQGPYSAAKAAGRILMDTCRVELKPFGVRFLSLYPGFVATERVAEDGIPAPFEISEQKAAEHMLYALEKDKQDYLFPFSLRWLIRLARVLPKPLVEFILKNEIPDDY